MIIKSKIVRDTVLLTAMQLFLDTAALLLNVFITRRLGTPAMGVIALTGTFFGLAGMISNGNAYLCTSRLISEELGKPSSAPEKVLSHGIRLCLMLSIGTSAVIAGLADVFSGRIFGGAVPAGCIRLMPAALIPGALAACLKGYFNACRRSPVTAAGDILEFLVRCAAVAFMVVRAGEAGSGTVCAIMMTGMIAGSSASLIYFSLMYMKLRGRSGGECSLSFRRYAGFALPIMGGGILTAVLSSANDALIPVCLRQYGDSAGRALSLFGVFEAIVIPALFFPSVILCSMSGLIVSETARAAAGGDRRRIKELSGRLTEWTLMYAVFSAAVLMRYGGIIGEMLGGGELAGRMIPAIAPVVPFIYMEIILEAMIKGMGYQGFSSMNYLAEYAVRISVVLVAVPRLGFWGIAASYYASNVLGNCSRCAKLIRSAGMPFRPVRTVGVPVVYAFMTMKAAELLVRAVSGGTEGLTQAAAVTLLWGSGYLAVFLFLGRLRPFGMKKTLSFGKNAQQIIG